MRNYLFILLLALAIGPAIPTDVAAEQPMLAQAKSKKKKKKAAAEEADESGEDAKKAAEEATKAASESAESTASEEAENAAKNAEEAAAEPAEEDAKDPASTERIPLAANFSNTEIITASSAYVVGLGLLGFGPNIFGAPDPAIGTPKVGSLDYNISARFHGDLVDPGPFLFGVPDYVGLLGFPAGGSLFYLGSAAYYWGTGDTLFGQSVNIDHSAMGFVEALGWTALATGVTKLVVGRERPYKALNRPEFGDDFDDPESNVSFFSGHTSISFVSASYMAHDLSDHLMKNGSGWWTGTFIPYLSLYGLASLVGVSRIYDQKHYTSDVLMGALVGGLIGNLTYIAHFDTDGNPRIRNPEALENVELSVGPITTPSGAQGVGLLGRW